MKITHYLYKAFIIPTLYNCPMLFKKNGNPANELRFKFHLEHMGIECAILGKGASVEL